MTDGTIGCAVLTVCVAMLGVAGSSCLGNWLRRIRTRNQRTVRYVAVRGQEMIEARYEWPNGQKSAGLVDFNSREAVRQFSAIANRCLRTGGTVTTRRART